MSQFMAGLLLTIRASTPRTLSLVNLNSLDNLWLLNPVIKCRSQIAKSCVCIYGLPWVLRCGREPDADDAEQQDDPDDGDDGQHSGVAKMRLIVRLPRPYRAASSAMETYPR